MWSLSGNARIAEASGWSILIRSVTLPVLSFTASSLALKCFALRIPSVLIVSSIKVWAPPAEILVYCIQFEFDDYTPERWKSKTHPCTVQWASLIRYYEKDMTANT